MSKYTYPANPTQPAFKFPGRLAPYLASAAFVAASLSAQSNLYWNPATGGAGNWNSTDTVWSTDPAGPGDTAWSSSANATDIAIFDFNGGTVSLQSALGGGGMTFDVDGYTVSAPSATQFQLNADRAIHVAAGSEATLGANFRLMAPGGGVGFEKTGAGTLVVAGPTGSNQYFGGTASGDTRRIVVSGGTLRVQTAALSNTRNLLDIAAGAVVDVTGINMNFGGFEGDGTITNTSVTPRSLLLRGAGLNFSGVVEGNLGISKLNGTGSQTLSGAQPNTFSGAVGISIGSIFMAKDAGVTAISGSHVTMNAGSTSIHPVVLRWFNNEQIGLTTGLHFGALTTGINTVDLNGYSERLGSLVLNDPGAYVDGEHRIDFGTNATAQYLWFSDFLVNHPDAPFIRILNFEEGVDSLRFDSNPTASLSYLRFDDGEELLTAMTSFDAVNDYWVVAPIPEPAAAWLLALGAFGYLLWTRRRA